ncbi:MAG: hypothetical protein VYA07_01760 [Candidatus Thermoplasmatota archaeon]|nr:hypothetical protein [Candidatus Thermoplasmatota archaeon]
MEAEYADIAIIMGITGAMLSMLGMGLLIAYYGSSKTRNAGFFFLILGLGLGYYLTTTGDTVELHNSLLAFIGGMLGGMLGIIVFLVAIIKS